VPPTGAARAVIWGALALAALAFAWPPRAPGRLALVGDTDQCRIDSRGTGSAPCDCARTPLAVREVLGVPAPLNALRADELARVPGIGPRRAAAIVAEREAHGPFLRLDDLAERVSGLGPKTVDRIRPRWSAGPDPACGGSRE
jgi:competence ComEA-like helix-hairpin-helix protein